MLFYFLINLCLNLFQENPKVNQILFRENRAYANLQSNEQLLQLLFPIMNNTFDNSRIGHSSQNNFLFLNLEEHEQRSRTKY